MQQHVNVNCNVSFNDFLEQSSCPFSWINKRHDSSVEQVTKCHSQSYYGYWSRDSRVFEFTFGYLFNRGICLLFTQLNGQLDCSRKLSKIILNVNVSFNNFLEQSICPFSWINERRDNTKLDGKTVGANKRGIMFSVQRRYDQQVTVCTV